MSTPSRPVTTIRAYIVGTAPRGLGDRDLAPSPGAPMTSSAVIGEDQRDGRGQPDTGHDVRQRGRPQHVPDPRPAAEPVDAGGLVGDRVDVLDAVQHLDEHLPERGVHDQQQRRAQFGAVQQHRQRDQGDRGDRAQELDRRGGDRAQHTAPTPIEHADDDPGQTAMARPRAQPVRVSPSAVQNAPSASSSAKAPGDPAGRREVVLRDETGRGTASTSTRARPRDRRGAPRGAARGHRPPRQQLVRGPVGVVMHSSAPGRAHENRAPRRGLLAAEDAVLLAQLRQRLDGRLVGSAGHFGRVTCASTVAGILVYVVRIWRASSGWASA